MIENASKGYYIHYSPQFNRYFPANRLVGALIFETIEDTHPIARYLDDEWKVKAIKCNINKVRAMRPGINTKIFYEVRQ